MRSREVPSGFLFDMDGLLLDSERLARDAFVTACAEFGWAVDLDVYHRCIGSTYARTREILTDHFGPEFPYEDVDTRWNEHYHARLAQGPVPLKTGAAQLLGFLAEIEMPVALATSTRRSTALKKLEDAGILRYFHHLVCGGETELGKPNPDPYLAAADGLGVQPDLCWALEDSENGVRAAHAAGCLVFQVPDLVEPSAELRTLGHSVEPSLVEVLSRIQLAIDRESAM